MHVLNRERWHWKSWLLYITRNRAWQSSWATAVMPNGMMLESQTTCTWLLTLCLPSKHFISWQDKAMEVTPWLYMGCCTCRGWNCPCICWSRWGLSWYLAFSCKCAIAVCSVYCGTAWMLVSYFWPLHTYSSVQPCQNVTVLYLQALCVCQVGVALCILCVLAAWLDP